MSKDPAVLFYTSDFLTGTMTMTDIQVGQYIRLLCLQHQKGLLSEKDMINICKSYDEDVFNKFTKEGDFYFNERMKFEHEKRVAFSKSRSENRINGHNKKPIKPTKKSKKSYDNHMENENENIITKIIEYLNEKSQKNFSIKTISSRLLVSKLLASGYTSEQFAKVINSKCKKWNGDPKMDDYLRPQTLFALTNFESYVNEKENLPQQSQPKQTAVGNFGSNGK